MTFTIRIRTVSALNRREHWATRSSRVKDERAETAWAFRQAVVVDRGTDCANVPDLPIIVTLTRIAPRELDGHDNLRAAMKGVVDELTAQLYLPSDRDKRCEWRYAQRRGKPKEYAVEVEISGSPAVAIPASTANRKFSAKGGLTPTATLQSGITAEMMLALDGRAKALGVTRAVVVRGILEEWLEREYR